MTDQLIPGAYYRYTPKDRHCREGIACAHTYRDTGEAYLVDTFWGAEGDPSLSCINEHEAKTAQLFFDPDAGWHIPTHDEDTSEFESSDIRVVTWQHGLRSMTFVRDGATASDRVRVENAVAAVEQARAALSSAQSQLKWAEDDLARLSLEINQFEHAEALVAEAIGSEDFSDPVMRRWLINTDSHIFDAISRRIWDQHAERLVYVQLDVLLHLDGWHWYLTGYTVPSGQVYAAYTGRAGVSTVHSIWSAEIPAVTEDAPALPVSGSVARDIAVAAFTHRLQTNETKDVGNAS
ncbi:hypothetical protein [Pseudoclavibacter soli]|uniref:hypothetical protein n=1 Tax=Pseudoclavibacter soli TaxID=452623 RepID=UPI0003FE8192|nr:hypothetical protein [Pseudoclavibacter soli]